MGEANYIVIINDKYVYIVYSGSVTSNGEAITKSINLFQEQISKGKKYVGVESVKIYVHSIENCIRKE